jgi:hypothetical protein
MADESAYVTAREAKAAWDVGDIAGADALRDALVAWALAKGGTIDRSAEGILSLVVDGASEQLL